MRPRIPDPVDLQRSNSRSSSQKTKLEIKLIPKIGRRESSVPRRSSNSARSASVDPRPNRPTSSHASGPSSTFSPININHRWFNNNSGSQSKGSKPRKIATKSGKNSKMPDANRLGANDAVAKSSAKSGSSSASGAQGEGRPANDSKNNTPNESDEEIDLDDLSSSDDDATHRRERKDTWGNIPTSTGPNSQPQNQLEAAEEERMCLAAMHSSCMYNTN